jgi:hypothetical protein
MGDRRSGIAAPAKSSWAFRAWLGACFLLVLLAAVAVTAWVVRNAALGTRFSERQTLLILTLADFPSLARQAVSQVLGIGSNPLLIELRTKEHSHWVDRFPSPEDDGYLLLPTLDAALKQAVVKLIRISDGREMARWVPDWKSIDAKISEKTFAPKGDVALLQPTHPLLLSDGDLIFNTHNAMVRQSACGGEPVWVLDQAFNHSNEPDAEGNVWAPSLATDGFADNPWLREHVQDDALALVSVDGKVLKRISFVGVLRRNGLEAFLMGRSGGQPISDPIHLNQISEARTDSRYWKKGDLLISSRHLSTLFLYRPSTDRIIWYKTGPWMNQHSSAFVNDHQISVFDNNVYGGASADQPFMAAGQINRVMLYDFANDRVTEPYAKLLEEARPVTIFAGRAQVLSDGGLFIEENEAGRHLRFTRDRLLWSRINYYDERHQWISASPWARYLTPAEVNAPLHALRQRRCAGAR